MPATSAANFLARNSQGSAHGTKFAFSDVAGAIACMDLSARIRGRALVACAMPCEPGHRHSRPELGPAPFISARVCEGPGARCTCPPSTCKPICARVQGPADSQFRWRHIGGTTRINTTHAHSYSLTHSPTHSLAQPLTLTLRHPACGSSGVVLVLVLLAVADVG